MIFGNKLRYGWSKADLHLHTTYSDGWMTPEETIDIIARRTDMRVIAVTDHDTAEGAFIAQKYARKHHPNLDVVVGQEVTTGDGDVIGLYLNASLPYFDSAAAAINAIHKQGGLAVAVHPYTFGWGVMECVGDLILSLPFDAVEVRHGCPVSIGSNFKAKRMNKRGQQLPQLGSSDSHIPYTVGEPFTWYRGKTAADLRRAIKAGEVEPGGSLWKVRSMLRKVPILLTRSKGRHAEPQTSLG